MRQQLQPVQLGIQHLLPHRALTGIYPAEHPVHVQVLPGGAVHREILQKGSVVWDAFQGAVLLRRLSKLVQHPPAQPLLTGHPTGKQPSYSCHSQQDQEHPQHFHGASPFF